MARGQVVHGQVARWQAVRRQAVTVRRMTDAFFEPLGDDRWRATVHTTGPWDARFQHGGPPSALLGREVERRSGRDDLVTTRVTVEILGAVPVGELVMSSRVSRPGRSVELVQAVLSAGGRDVARAEAWRVLRTTQEVASRDRPAPPLPPPAPPAPLGDWIDGYLSAVEWRFTTGAFGEVGPATAWARLLHPIVPDEAPTPLARVLAVADSGNGLSSELPITGWHFINPELTVHLHREAVGEWVCLDARTAVSPGGAGLATSVLSDEAGPLGVGAQSLLVAPR